jgi:predicted ATP-grasp superfamily ATP-dependent carboligase
VIPTDDQVLLALSEHYDELKDCAYIACPPPEIAWKILDKAATLDVAQKCGLRIPKTRLVSNSAQLLELTSCFAFPWVLKPARKELNIEEIKSLTLRSAGDVAAKFLTPKDFAPPMLLQEYCCGHGVGVEILLHNGECVAVFQHRRLKELPYTGGFSVSAIAEAPNPLLVQQSLTLLRALQWEGPAMVEFKIDATGGAVLMEINGRYWGTISLPIYSGVNFPLYHWQAVHGETSVVLPQYAVGTKWRWTAGHMNRLHDLILAARRSKAALEELILSLRQLSGRDAIEENDAIFSSPDPMPAIFDLIQTIRYLAARDFGAFTRRLSRARLIRESSSAPRAETGSSPSI